MSPHPARNRPSTVDRRRYDAAFVVIAVPRTGQRPDEMAPATIYRIRQR